MRRFVVHKKKLLRLAFLSFVVLVLSIFGKGILGDNKNKDDKGLFTLKDITSEVYADAPVGGGEGDGGDSGEGGGCGGDAGDAGAGDSGDGGY